jgi:hypothetical protein
MLVNKQVLESVGERDRIRTRIGVLQRISTLSFRVGRT